MLITVILSSEQIVVSPTLGPSNLPLQVVIVPVGIKATSTEEEKTTLKRVRHPKGR